MVSEISINAQIVIVGVRGPTNRGGTLKNPQITSIDGKKFLTGISQQGRGHWSDGQLMHVALDEISMITEFATEAEHEAKCKWARRRSRGFFARLRRR